MDIYSLLDSTAPTKLAANTVHYLMSYGRKKQFNVDDVVIKEGDPSDAVYIILNGEASVVKEDAFGNSHVIASTEIGSTFGEMGVFMNLARSGTIVAKTPLSVLELSRSDFVRALHNFPDLSLRLFKSLSVKLDSINGKFSNLLNVMGMIQLGTYITEHQKGGEQALQIYEISAMINETGLDRRDIANMLTNYHRLAVIDQVDYMDDNKVAFTVDYSKLSEYLKCISLNSASCQLQ